MYDMLRLVSSKAFTEGLHLKMSLVHNQTLDPDGHMSRGHPFKALDIWGTTTIHA